MPANQPHQDKPAPLLPAGETLFTLLSAASELGLRTAPTEKEPYRVEAEGDISELPPRLFRLVQAIEAMEETDEREIAQILDGAVTILRLKLALYSLLGWITAQGIQTKEVAQLVLQAVSGPIKPNGSLSKLQQSRAAIAKSMGAAGPQMGA